MVDDQERDGEKILKDFCLLLYHHHTVQVAMCAYSFVRTLVNALVLQ